MSISTNLVITSSMANTYNDIMNHAICVFYTSGTECSVPMAKDGDKYTAMITFIKREEEMYIDTIDIVDGYTDDLKTMLYESCITI